MITTHLIMMFKKIREWKAFTRVPTTIRKKAVCAQTLYDKYVEQDTRPEGPKEEFE